MASNNINVGSAANDGEGQNLRDAFISVRKNFAQMFGITYTGDTQDLSGTTFSSDVITQGSTNKFLTSGSVGASELDVTGNGNVNQVLSSDGDGTMSWADAASGGNTASYVTSSAISPWIDKNVYVFTNTSDLTHTLPTTAVGVSFKMSLRGTGTNTLSRNGNLIMGLAENLVLDDLTASFEFFFAGGTQGWVIIGAN